jgi:NAD(P)H-flavin reductase
MSSNLSQMKEGDTLELLGPVGAYEYKPNTNDEVLMVAGGSGITPFYAILNYIFRTKPLEDTQTKFELLYANRLPENILLRKELDALAAEFPNRFKVVYVVDEIPTGYPADPSLRVLKTWRSTMAQFPGRKPSKNVQILVCGPPVMETAVAQLFREGGVDERQIRTFTKAGMAEPNPVPIVVNKLYSMEDVSRHSKPEDAWTAISGKVYDITKFISEHPGGDIIMDGVGKDATDLFENEFSHSDDAKKLLASFQIGFVKKT